MYLSRGLFVDSGSAFRGRVSFEEFKDLMGFMDKKTSTEIFLLQAKLEDYDEIRNWLVTATCQKGSTIIKAEPMGTETSLGRDKHSHGQEDGLRNIVKSSERICFHDRRSERLLSRNLNPILEGFKQIPIPHLPTRDTETWWLNTLRDKDLLTAHLSNGGQLRLSMRLHRHGPMDTDRTSDWVVKKYEPRDKHDMIRLYKWYDDTTLNLNEWNNSWQAKHTLIGQSDAGICGFCLPLPGSLIGLRDDLGIIGEIYVEPRHRRKGLGKALLIQAIKELSSYPEIRTGTTLPNIATYNLLNKTSFVTDSITPKRANSLYIQN